MEGSIVVRTSATNASLIRNGQPRLGELKKAMGEDDTGLAWAHTHPCSWAAMKEIMRQMIADSARSKATVAMSSPVTQPACYAVDESCRAQIKMRQGQWGARPPASSAGDERPCDSDVDKVPTPFDSVSRGRRRRTGGHSHYADQVPGATGRAENYHAPARPLGRLVACAWVDGNERRRDDDVETRPPGYRCDAEIAAAGGAGHMRRCPL